MKIRALVFDDDDTIRSMIREWLERRGYEVYDFPDPASCPLHALEVCHCSLHGACSDVIVSDLDMPNMRGLDFIASQEAKGCKCPNKALMSGAWTQEERRRAVELGCKVFEKPFPVGELFDWLDEVEAKIEGDRVLSDWETVVKQAESAPEKN